MTREIKPGYRSLTGLSAPQLTREVYQERRRSKALRAKCVRLREERDEVRHRLRLAEAWLAERDRHWNEDVAGADLRIVMINQKKMDEAREAFRASLAIATLIVPFETSGDVVGAEPRDGLSGRPIG